MRHLSAVREIRIDLSNFECGQCQVVTTSPSLQLYYTDDNINLTIVSGESLTFSHYTTHFFAKSNNHMNTTSVLRLYKVQGGFLSTIMFNLYIYVYYAFI